MSGTTNEEANEESGGFKCAVCANKACQWSCPQCERICFCSKHCLEVNKIIRNHVCQVGSRAEASATRRGLADAEGSVP